ncbi:hypothetical protein V8F06_013078, partial [Rhypophila decipiens]
GTIACVITARRDRNEVVDWGHRHGASQPSERSALDEITAISRRDEGVISPQRHDPPPVLKPKERIGITLGITRGADIEKIRMASWNSLNGASVNYISNNKEEELTLTAGTAVTTLGLGLGSPLPFLKDGPTSGFEPSSVLILGGSSALGASTIQLLRFALPTCKILTTSPPKHHGHLTTVLDADGALDRNSSSLVADVRSATAGGKGVDAILSMRLARPARSAMSWTHSTPTDRNDTRRSRDLVTIQGGGNVMLVLETLLEQGRNKLPLPVRHVGHGLDGLEKGLEMMRNGARSCGRFLKAEEKNQGPGMPVCSEALQLIGLHIATNAGPSRLFRRSSCAPACAPIRPRTPRAAEAAATSSIRPMTTPTAEAVGMQ